ncbi:jg22807 [Pararge aegeria aegeria]|uniref:Jg22807 protein n=1 Tax=Pararge aegeria aegeria TaxID=348720 RepID=A0A8S4RWW9_9NEOP|nr:jg22807 [Pararge aegeria aegeria]
MTIVVEIDVKIDTRLASTLRSLLPHFVHSSDGLSSAGLRRRCSVTAERPRSHRFCAYSAERERPCAYAKCVTRREAGR